MKSTKHSGNVIEDIRAFLASNNITISYEKKIEAGDRTHQIFVVAYFKVLSWYYTLKPFLIIITYSAHENQSTIEVIFTSVVKSLFGKWPHFKWSEKEEIAFVRKLNSYLRSRKNAP